MSETKTSADLNPNAAPVKQMEMTVRRALMLIEAFEALEDGLDWQEVPGGTYRKIIGNRYEYPRLLEECYNRFKRGTLYAEVLDLYENLPPSVQGKKEIKDGIRAIRKRLAE